MSEFQDGRTARNDSVVFVALTSANELSLANDSSSAISVDDSDTAAAAMASADNVRATAAVVVSETPIIERKEVTEQERPSSPTKCTICISPCKNLAKTDVCNHQFCFECIKRWSREKNNCPLCKRVFNAIHYNFKGEKEHSVHKVSRPSSRNNVNINEIFYDQLEAQRMAREIRVSSIFNSQNSRSLNDYFMRHPAIEFVDLSIGGVNSPVHSHRIYNRFLSVSTSAFRRSIYYSNLWTVPFRNSVEEVTVHDFLTNESYEIKLRPWLNREVLALMGNDNPLQQIFVGEMYQVLRLENVLSRNVLNLCEVYLRHRSLHFLHEMNTFMRSRLDMNAYDSRIQFSDRSESHTESILHLIARNNQNRTQISNDANRAAAAAAATTLIHLHQNAQQSLNQLTHRLQQTRQGSLQPETSLPPPPPPLPPLSTAQATRTRTSMTTSTAGRSSSRSPHENSQLQALNMISPIIESAMTDYMSIFRPRSQSPNVITLNSDDSDNESDSSVMFLGNGSELRDVEVIDLFSDSEMEVYVSNSPQSSPNVVNDEPIIVPSSSSSSSSSPNSSSASSTSWESIDTESFHDESSLGELETNTEFDPERESEEDRERETDEEEEERERETEEERESETESEEDRERESEEDRERESDDSDSSFHYEVRGVSSRPFRRMQFPIAHRRRCPLWRFSGFDFTQPQNLGRRNPILDYWEHSTVEEIATELAEHERAVRLAETESPPVEQSSSHTTIDRTGPEIDQPTNTLEIITDTSAVETATAPEIATDTTSNSAVCLENSQIKTEVKVEQQESTEMSEAFAGTSSTTASNGAERPIETSSRHTNLKRSLSPSMAELVDTEAAPTTSTSESSLPPFSFDSLKTNTSDSERPTCSPPTNDIGAVIVRKKNHKRHKLN